jgi:hypothetical protein
MRPSEWPVTLAPAVEKGVNDHELGDQHPAQSARAMITSWRQA